MRKVLVCALVALFVLPSLLSAATKEDAARREHVRELLDLVGVERSMRAGFHAVLEQTRQKMMARYETGESDDQEAVAGAEASKKELNEYLDRYEEVFFQKLDVKAIEDEVYIPLYEKYFSDEEVQQLVAFYKTSAGRKAIETMPEIMQESVARSNDIMQSVVADTLEQLKGEQEKKFPWRRTMSDMRSMATAIEAYATDADEYPAETDYAHLKSTLSPTYIRELPEKDAWGNPYEVIVSPDHQHYRVVSAGADGVVEWDSRTIKIAEEGKEIEAKVTDSIDDDIIYQDGSFVQYPRAANRPGVDLP